jgi:hypothetical protein
VAVPACAGKYEMDFRYKQECVQINEWLMVLGKLFGSAEGLSGYFMGSIVSRDRRA